jgi:hypothetical protein
MKENIDVKELKEVCKMLNESGLIKQKIKLVAISTENLVKAFAEAIEKLPEDADIPAKIAEFYNETFADELADDEGGNEDEDGDAGDSEDDDQDEDDQDEDGDDDDQDEDDQDDDQDGDDDGQDDDQDGEDSDDDQDDQDTTVEPEAPKSIKKKDAPKAEKKPKEKDEKKKPLIQELKPKKEKLMVSKRAEVNPKLSLKAKVKNILNFADQKYKKTTYFPLDVETIRVLDENVGLYPSEIYESIKSNKNSWKKVEGFSNVIAIREINKIKSAYSYIVGAIDDNKVGSKFHHIMSNLVAGKEVSAEIAHPSTVKVARRALLAYMEVTGIDYSVMKDTRKELVVEASKKDSKKIEKQDSKKAEKKESKKK